METKCLPWSSLIIYHHPNTVRWAKPKEQPKQSSWAGAGGSGSLQAHVPMLLRAVHPSASHLGSSPGSIREGQCSQAASTWARWPTGKYWLYWRRYKTHSPKGLPHKRYLSSISTGLWVGPAQLFAQILEKLHRLSPSLDKKTTKTTQPQKNPQNLKPHICQEKEVCWKIQGL